MESVQKVILFVLINLESRKSDGTPDFQFKNELTKQQTDTNLRMSEDLSIGTPPIVSSTFSIHRNKIFATLGALQEARVKFNTNTTVDQSEVPDIDRSPTSPNQAMIQNPFSKLFSGAGLQEAKHLTSLQMSIGVDGIPGLQNGSLLGKKKSLFDTKDLKSIYSLTESQI
jgi:hypothetical protein